MTAQDLIYRANSDHRAAEENGHSAAHRSQLAAQLKQRAAAARAQLAEHFYIHSEVTPAATCCFKDCRMPAAPGDIYCRPCRSAIIRQEECPQ